MMPTGRSPSSISLTTDPRYWVYAYNFGEPDRHTPSQYRRATPGDWRRRWRRFSRRHSSLRPTRDSSRVLLQPGSKRRSRSLWPARSGLRGDPPPIGGDGGGERHVHPLLADQLDQPGTQGLGKVVV